MSNFEQSRFAVLSAFGTGTRENLDTVLLTPDKNGNIVCAEAKGENPEREGYRVWQIGFEWEEPRDIRGIDIRFAEEYNGLDIAEMYVQYWKSVWPSPTPSHRAGALRGWMGTDDAFNGHFTEAYGEITVDRTHAENIFDHIDITEARDNLFAPGGDIFSSDDFNAFFRRTLKMRVLFIAKEAPVVSSFTIYGNCEEKEKICEIFTGVLGTHGEISLSAGGVGIYNGELKDISGSGPLRIAYTASADPLCDGDRTSLRLDVEGGYSFSVYDTDIDSGVYMEDYDILLRRVCDTPAKETVKALMHGKSVYDRVPEEPEQTLERAFAEVPEMDVTKQQPYGRYVIMGWDGLRKNFCLRYNGDIFADKGLSKCARRDLAKTRWGGAGIHFRILTGDPANRREGRNDCRQYMPDARVPVYVTEWKDREIEYRQTSFCIPRDLSLIGRNDLRGDEDIIILNRVEIRNAADTAHTSRFYIEPMPSERLELIGTHLAATGRVMPEDTVSYGWKVSEYGDTLMRLDIKTEKGSVRCIPQTRHGDITFSMRPGQSLITTMYTGRRQEFETSGSVDNTLLYEVALGPYETTHADFAIPYNTPTDAGGMDAVSEYDFDRCLELATGYWRAFADKAGGINLPEDRHLCDFVKAVPWHVILTAMRDPVSGNYIIPAGTYTYSACGNEACMQIRMMDYLGYHDYAEKYLESYIASQGMGGLDGNFKTRDGVFFATNYGGRGVNDDEFCYNLDHGYILECFADHYFLTGDKKWLSRIAHSLVDGCDFVLREREATKVNAPGGGKVSYFGLLPHGHLEDNNEWRCWFAVNAHACGGILRVAAALAEIGHPEAERLQKEADAYRSDIRDCLIRAVANSPAVPTGNGGYMPHVPTRCELRGRDLGWFREAAYGPLHLTYGMVLDSREKLTEWILRDLEDNLFLSRGYGRIADKEKYWFSQGGVTIQSNLLFNDLTYLERGEPERAIRALYNDFAVNLYRDMNCFTEHAVPEFGHGIGPFFKTPDESQFICFLRNHLVREDAGILNILQGAPRRWFEPGKSIRLDCLPTFFGEVSVKVDSEKDSVTAAVKANWRKAPEKLILYVRDANSRKPGRVTVSGGNAEPDGGDRIVITSPGNSITVAVEY